MNRYDYWALFYFLFAFMMAIHAIAFRVPPIAVPGLVIIAFSNVAKADNERRRRK